MATRKTVHCTLCGYDVKLDRIGLTDRGEYDAESAPQHEVNFRVDTFGGPKKLTVTREPLPMPFALGMRAALQAALARVEAEIIEGGGGELL